MLRFTEAQEIIRQQARSFGTEMVPLDAATGRVLQEWIYTDREYPPFNRSAMDGYALRFSELENGARKFRVAANIYAGELPAAAAGSGECYRIMTGAAVPEEMNVVVRVEDALQEGEYVSILSSTFQPKQNIASRGEDLMSGVEILSAPTVCSPTEISVLAALGAAKITVSRLPRVAVITTGNEVIPVHAAPNTVQIRNSNGALLHSLLRNLGISPVSNTHSPDDISLLKAAFSGVLTSDFIISCGGVSAGDADFIPEVLNSMGVRKLFHKVAIKPGKPIWCGKTDSGTMVFSLPGNPLSCLVTFKLFVEPYIRSCYGLSALPFQQYSLEGVRRKNSSLDEFFPVVRLRNSPVIAPIQHHGSGDITAALGAFAIAWHPSDQQEIGNELVGVVEL